MAQRERVVYLNGEFIPESRAGIPIRDRGFVLGDAVFDTARTFNGQLFKLQEHIDRLFDSCRYLRLDPGLTRDEFIKATNELLEMNLPLLQPNEDYWVTQRVTRGTDPIGPDDEIRPTVLIECKPLPLAKRAKGYRDGLALLTPSIPRTSPKFISPRAKTHNYLNLVLGELEVHDKDPDAWALLLDEDGNLTEGRGSNVFVVKGGVLSTPRELSVLAGITRETVLSLAVSLKIPAAERDIDLYESYTSDEMFLTSTSLCICPVSSINGATVGQGSVPGPVTERLMSAFSDLVGMDYVAQYLARIPESN